jgi:hypothetical protein
MIRVDRTRVTAPRTLKSKAAATELARAEKFFRRPAEKRTQEIFAFDAGLFGGLADSVPLNRALDTQLALLESFTKPEAPYSEMARQLLEPFLRKFVS